MLIRRRVLAAKIETTPGTAETLAAADGAFNAYNVSIQATVPTEERLGQGSFGRLSSVPGARMGRVTFRTDLAWDGSTTMPSWADVLLPMCGIVESSQVYTPRSESPGSNVKTGTIGVYEDGMLKSIAGAVGTGRLVMPTGSMCYIDWEFTGVWQPVTDTALISPTYPVATPIRYASATTTYNSVALCNQQVTLDFGNVIKVRECESSAAGYKSAIITDRNPKVTINPESVLVATQDRYGAWLSATESALSIELDGPSDSTITLAGPKAQILNVQEGDREGVQIDDIELQLNKDGANVDQEFSLTFAELTP